MEKEMNYLSERIGKMDHAINLCDFGIGVGVNTQ